MLIYFYIKYQIVNTWFNYNKKVKLSHIVPAYTGREGSWCCYGQPAGPHDPRDLRPDRWADPERLSWSPYLEPRTDPAAGCTSTHTHTQVG